jgi:hypothetical protein
MAIDESRPFEYSDIVLGHDEPDVIWSKGDVIIEMCHKLGDDHPVDIDGNDINPNVGYSITKKGIYRS